ncbi:hypothetical protein WG906_04445 [Pedobacter sp. P351]|uniref:hypothetical protein n=1 Tax=Pedobacter superstes TaxID=3133441 RepID=UPI003096B5BB
MSDSNKSVTDFIAHKGEVEKIRYVSVRKFLRPGRRDEVRVKLKTYRSYFTSNNSKDILSILSKIDSGDKVTIYTKPKFLNVFGMKKFLDICELHRARETIVDYEEYKRSIYGMDIAFMTASAGFFLLFYIRTKKKYNAVLI